jgi:hypothetical protein
MKKLSLHFIIIMVFFSCLEIKSQTTVSSTGSQNEVQKLQNEIQNLKIKIDTLQRKINDGKHNLDCAEVTYTTATRVFSLKESIFVFILPILSLIVAIALFFGLNQFIKFIINNKVNELSEQNIKEMNRLVTNEKWGINLRKRVKLLILNKTGTSIKSKILTIVKDFEHYEIPLNEFSGKAFTDGLEAKKVKFSKDNLTIAILDDTITEYEVVDTSSFMNEIQKQKMGILLYGNSKLPDYELKAFASNAYSFYDNLMKLLKYMDLISN